MKIFLICPVRKSKKGRLQRFFERIGWSENKEAKEQEAIAKYVADLEKAGHKVHWPPRNTDQNDPIGLRILYNNTKAIIKRKNTRIWWKEKSTGSKYDFGATLCLKILGEMLESGELKPRELIELLKDRSIIIANPEKVEKIVEEENKNGIGKSFNKVILELHKRNQEEGKK